MFTLYLHNYKGQMSIVEWDESLSIGIPVIDKQHQTLFLYINNLLECVLSAENQGLDSIFEKLHAYTEQHFSYEEKIFENFNFTLKNDHKSHHNALKSALQDNYTKYRNDTLKSSELMEFLLRWISEHITIEDRKYADELKDKIMALATNS